MRLKVEYGDGVTVLPEKVASLLPGVTCSELSVLIYLLSQNRLKDEIDISSVAGELKLEESAVNAAIGFWRGAGILCENERETKQRGAKVTVKETKGKNGGVVTTVISGDIPHYTGEEIERLFSAEPMLGAYIDECQKILGRIFTPLEINKMLSLREYYGLDCEYVLLLCSYCSQIDKRSVPYVEKTAKSFIDEGVTAIAALEEKLEFLRRFHSVEGLVRKLCGLKSRALTAKEKKFVERWTELDISPDIIEIAYEVAVNNTGSASMPYMNRVLSNWIDSGYKSSEEVFAGIEAYRKKKEQKEKEGGSFDTDEFFESALKRSLERHLREVEEEAGNTEGAT